MINKNISIEELVSSFPDTVSFLALKGIRCIRCGEALWGTLESAAAEKGFSDKEIDELVIELNVLINSKK